MSARGTYVGSKSKFGLRLILGLAALLAAVTWWAPASIASASDPVIDTESGELQGTVGTQIIEYLGIPYAAPPVGALRWTPTQPFGTWSGIRQATKAGSECPQVNPVSKAFVGVENCLFLNVYTPVGKDTVKPHDRAVLVWIHGGGLTKGAGSDYDPTPLVEGGDIIVVTFNYRLGLLGFFAEADLDAEPHLPGNYGLMDQQFALAWVQKNIAAFGGDPNRVTVAGESAGGLSVYSQLASPLAAGLFQQAIAQSGAYAGFTDYRPEILTLSAAETVGYLPFVQPGSYYATAADCAAGTDVANAACLRALTPSAILTLQGKSAVYPTVDGTLLTKTPGDAFAMGDFNQVPIITGNNHDEYRYFVADDFTLPIANPQYSSVFSTVFASMAPSVEEKYPASKKPSPPIDDTELKLAAAGTDGIFVCPARLAEESLSLYVTVYAYEFHDEHAPPPAVPFPGLNFPLGAYHSADVQYLFNLGGVPAPFKKKQQKLSNAMISYWTHFVKNGDPNSTDQPNWAPYVSSIDERQSFVPPTPVVEPGSTFDSFHKCSSYWDGQ